MHVKYDPETTRSTDGLIDQIVYRLYGLTEEDELEELKRLYGEATGR